MPEALPSTDRSRAPHYSWGQNCEGWRLLDRPGVAVIEEQVPPGAGESWHVHERARQFFYVLAGHAELATTGGVTSLSAGQSVEVPPGLAHRFMNTGENDVRFLVISTPSTRGDRKEVANHRAGPPEGS